MNKKTITETFEDKDSITLKRNAKGEYAWEIKVYGTDHHEMGNKLAKIDTYLKLDYIKEDN